MKCMPARVLTAAILAVSFGCATAGSPGGASSGGRDGAELAAVMDAIKSAIAQAETREVPGFPELKKIVLKLQTSVTRSAGGEVHYLVATVGGSASAETVSTLELELVPAAPPRRRPLVPEESLQDALSQAIHLAKAGVAQAAQGDPPLVMKAVSIDLKFTVTADGSAGAGVKLLPVGIGISATGSVSRSRVHAVSLTFAP